MFDLNVLLLEVVRELVQLRCLIRVEGLHLPFITRSDEHVLLELEDVGADLRGVGGDLLEHSLADFIPDAQVLLLEVLLLKVYALSKYTLHIF